MYLPPIARLSVFSIDKCSCTRVPVPVHVPVHTVRTPVRTVPYGTAVLVLRMVVLYVQYARTYGTRVPTARRRRTVVMSAVRYASWQLPFTRVTAQLGAEHKLSWR